MNVAFRRFTLAVLTCVAATPVSAHHSYSIFSMDKTIVYKGKVVEYRWVNPHAHILIKVDAGSGIDPESVGTWDIEGASTNIMGRQGWNKLTFKAGDQITLAGHPLKDGSKGAALFYAILPDGRRLYMDIARPTDGTK
jgi:uncharacterized protein DUF6152